MSSNAWSWERDPVKGFPCCVICGLRVTASEPASFHSRFGLRGRPVSVHTACGGVKAALELEDAA
jgi:hypothetical protein